MTLLPGEDLVFREPSREHERHLTDREIDDLYGSGEARIVTEQARYPLPAIPEMVDGPDYNLNPEFQRRHRWTNVRRSRLIESFIINVPIPPIFLYEDSYGHYEVMDGLQRLTAIRDFYRGVFALTDLEEWASLNGRHYYELPEQLKKGIDRRYLSSIILLQETAKSPEEAARLKQLVFERINSGGEKLTHQESRNAVNAGPMNDLCMRLSRNVNLCRTWKIPEPSETELNTGSPGPGDPVLRDEHYRRMHDVELVLRFFAYRQQLDYQSHRALAVYLDEYLRRANKIGEDLLQRFEELFEQTISLVSRVLGDHAFMLWRPDARGKFRYERRPTVAAYDPVMWAFSQYLASADLLVAASNEVVEQLKAYYEVNAETFSGRTANPADIRRRNSDISAILGRIVNR